LNALDYALAKNEPAFVNLGGLSERDAAASSGGII